MAEGHHPQNSRYVKLTKDQDDAPLEDITPGELHQPIQVPDLNTRRCHECGQPLPEEYHPPADEEWTTGICACADDPESCWMGLFCPCVLFGRNVEEIKDDVPQFDGCCCHAVCVEGGMAVAVATTFCTGIDPQTSALICESLFFAWWICGIYTGMVRQVLQKKYHLKDAPCDPCMVHCVLHWCALCQEHREMRNRLADNSGSDTTSVEPPPVQEMTSDDAADSNRVTAIVAVSPLPKEGDRTSLELQPL
ncbi:hypothetical protein MLD38_023805 [Melastoma candidum]|nr:hypothetical protein MLD38_023805 [Melastoma candidum]